MTVLYDDIGNTPIVDGPVDAHSYASAILNILDDAAEERAWLRDTQRAVINILDDFDIEKTKVERINVALRRATAVAEAATSELEAFSYSVAHDLRAPLRSIDGFSKALLEDYADKLDADGQEFLQLSRRSAQHMGLLIDALLMLAHVTQSEVRRETVDLSRIASIKALQLQQTQPDRRAQFTIADGITAQGDGRLLDIVLDNLMGNAWKFTGRRPQTQIEFGCERHGGSAVYFVRDNGAGFDMAYSKKLFGVFQRLHSVGEFDGTGIGLATVQRIVRRHCGRIWAEGAVDRGAVFSFTLQSEERL